MASKMGKAEKQIEIGASPGAFRLQKHIGHLDIVCIHPEQQKKARKSKRNGEKKAPKADIGCTADVAGKTTIQNTNKHVWSISSCTTGII